MFLYTESMHLIINSSDVFYLTGVCSHDPGEILLILGQRAKSNSSCVVDESQHTLLRRTGEQKGIIFCDARTSGLFDCNKFQIIDQRGEWKKVFGQYKTLKTDPDFLTQTLREKIE